MSKAPRILVIALFSIACSLSLVSSSDADGGKADAPPAAKKRRIQGPISCSRSEDRVLRNVILETSGTAISADGSCDILIVDSIIRSKSTAIAASGSSDVIVRNSVVRGRNAILGTGSSDLIIDSSDVQGKVALQLTGSADAALKGSKFHGRRIVSGSAEVQDLGGNRWSK